MDVSVALDAHVTQLVLPGALLGMVIVQREELLEMATDGVHRAGEVGQLVSGSM